MSPGLKKDGVAVSPQRFVSSARWALSAAWRANSRLLLGNIAVALARAFIPAAMALTARGLVNATVATVGAHGDLWSVIPWLLAGFALTAAEGVLQLTSGFFAQGLRDDLHYHVTLDVLEHASRLEIARYDDPRFYDLLQRARDQPAEHVARFVNEALNIGANVLQIISLLAILIYIEPLVLLVSIGLALPYFRFQWRLSLDGYAVERARTTRRRWSGYFVGLLSGSASVAEVRILGLAPLLIERFRKLMREFRVQDHVLYRRGYRGGSVFVVLITAAIYAAFVRVAYRVLHGSLTVGDLAVFGGATTRLRNAIQVVVQALSNTMERTLYIADVMQFLELPARAARQGSGVAPGARGEIELRDVSFAYPDAREPVLDHVSLHIRPGETVALVGENGAGKTTLVKLIAGLYQPDAGQVLFDGTDLRELAPEDLWRRIAFVFQSFGRYEASVSENVAYGDWQRLIDDPAAVREVATQAGVDDLIRSLPNGYDTNIGRQFGEHDLSGGQWQSIAVARAFARNAALLILDEPTSNLDARAEYTLFRRFQELAHGRTTIIVSHRFSTVRVADRILVMENGGIVESGSHDELIAHGGGYARLYDLHMQRLDPQRR